MQIRVLGHLEAQVEGRSLALGGAKQRAVLAMLVLEANRTVSAERLIEGIWGEDVRASAPKMLQNYIWRLRGALAENGAAEIVTHGRATSCASIPSSSTSVASNGSSRRPVTTAAARRARRWPCSAATRWPTWRMSRSRRPRSGGWRSCGYRRRSWR